MPLAVLLVHELRYRLAYGGHAGRAMAGQGHAYLSVAAPVIVMLSALAFGAFILRLARTWAGRRPGAPGRGHGTLALWGLAAAGLLAIYVGQELLEGWLSAGHAGGPAGVFGHGGWWAAPAAIAIGGLLALALRGARLAMLLAGARRQPRRARTRQPGFAPPRRIDLGAWTPLASCAAGRAPPISL